MSEAQAAHVEQPGTAVVRIVTGVSRSPNARTP